MAYHDSPYRRREAETTEPSGLSGEPRHRAFSGFREESLWPAPSSPSEYTAEIPRDRASTLASPPSAEPLDEPPAAAGPVRDRLAVHWLWEMVLLLGVAALIYQLWQAQPEALRGGALAQLLIAGAGFGLLGLAAGMTLRVGAPNLAIGPVAAAAGAYFAQRGSEGVVIPVVFMIGIAILLGFLVALLVAVFHVPGWAASLAAVGAVVVWLQLQPAELPLSGGYNPAGQAAFLFVLVAAVGILSGLLGTVRSVRQTVGGLRPDGDPARRRGGLAVMLAGAATVLSMVFSVVAGVLLVSGSGAPAQGSVGVNWLTWTMIGFGVALVGGTSAYGRRGGVFGTVLAVVALVLFHRYQQEQGWEIALLATATCAVAGGLVVTRLVERFGRPRSAGQASESRASAAAAGSDRSREVTSAEGALTTADSWSSALPARPVPGGAVTGSAVTGGAVTGGAVTGSAVPWDDDRWDSR